MAQLTKRDPQRVLGRLYAIYHQANERHFAGLLPMLPIAIVQIGKVRGRVPTYAYTTTVNEVPRRIFFDRHYVQVAPWPDIRETVLHELIHVWQGGYGADETHGPEFRRKAKELGISMRAVD